LLCTCAAVQRRECSQGTGRWIAILNRGEPNEWRTEAIPSRL
jgi:hypothetical protein